MGTPAQILVVDDEPNIRLTLQMVLEGEGWEVTLAPSAEDALARLADEPFDAMLLDVMMPGGMDGLTALGLVHGKYPDLPVVMISGHATLHDAVSATRAGAFDFLEKPLSRERVLVTVRNALRESSRGRELADLKARAGRDYAVGGLLGEAPALVRLREQIAKVAPTRARVLIQGESGTGKELIARAVHDQSERAAGPFVKVNCAAIPDELIESTLFGHEKGAFTGAAGRQRGQFELADGGTLFLDEIGDMSLSAQAKVLRVLQSGELTRVGSERAIKVDVRVLAATHKNLEAACQAGTFREDLYFRLNVVPLVAPPLRQRASDVPGLALHFLAQVCEENGFRRKAFEADVLDALRAWRWPGNVRELRNVVERMAILSGEVIGLDDLPDALLEVPERTVSDEAALAGEGNLRDLRDAAERRFIVERLEALDWNISRAADSLGLERTHLHKKMRALGIRRERG
jgi:two-component system nitrogen regulation response regulator NtrX